MRTSSAFALFGIVLAAIVIRLSPLWSFLYWGSDTGEYFRILRTLVARGRVSTVYEGWGVTYPYFPGTFFAQGGLVHLGGLEVSTVLNLLVPVLGALAVLPMFLLAVRIAKDVRPGLFAAVFLAGAIPHVYTTAHAAPATLGDLLALAGLLLFLRLRSDRAALVPLLLVTGALVATHHLSLYFFLAMVFGTLLVRGLVRPWTTTSVTRREVLCVSALSLGTFAYWFGHATTFRDFILTDVNVRPWWLLPAAFPIALAVFAGAIYARSRMKWRYRPRFPSLRHRAFAYITAVATVLFVGVVALQVGVPGTDFRVPAQGLVQFVPLILLLPFSASGRRLLDFLPDGLAPNAWLATLVLSALVGIVAAPHVLVPYRHMEYLMIPFGILAGIGFVGLIDVIGRRRSRHLAVAVCAVVLGANLLTGFPPPATFAGWREGTIPAALDAAYWARDHVRGLIASDHQGSTTVFGFGGIDASWDRARDPNPFLSASPQDPYAGLRAIPSPSGVKDATYIWIDRDMIAGVRIAAWETADPMHPDVIAKFRAAPFVKVFDNGHAQLLWVGWGCTPSPSTC